MVRQVQTDQSKYNRMKTTDLINSHTAVLDFIPLLVLLQSITCAMLHHFTCRGRDKLAIVQDLNFHVTLL